MVLGPIQSIIYNYVKEHPGSTAQEVGDACYKYSYGGKNGGDERFRENFPDQAKYFRMRWAAHVLRILWKKNLVQCDRYHPVFAKWTVVVL